MKFREYLNEINSENATSSTEDSELLNIIKYEIDELSDEEVDDFAYFLIDAFYDLDDSDDSDDLVEPENETFTKDELIDLIKDLGPDMYEFIYYELEDIEDDDELEESVSNRMKSSNYNRKKRKYMTLSKSKLRQTQADRKKSYRKTKNKRKQYYRANKQKIAKYQKSRREAIKKGKHKVKTRRQA